MAVPVRHRTRPGGRSERVRQQVAGACLSLLAEGRADFSPADVARRSGVTRTTIYRWWPTKADLLREALAAHTRDRLDPPDTGSWSSDVHQLTQKMATFFSDPVEVSQNAIMASGRHLDFDEVVLQHYAPLYVAWRQIVERADARGELRPDVDADTVLLTIASPLLVTPLVFHRTLTRTEVSRIADLIVAGTSASDGGATPGGSARSG